MNFSRALAAVFFIIFLASCSTTARDLCQSDFPKLSEELSRGQGGLDGFKPDESRQPASGEVSAAVEMSDEALRTQWKEWGVSQLNRSQAIQDILEKRGSLDPATGEALTQATDEWVLFYSYAENGEVIPMQESLRKIASSHRKAQEGACKTWNTSTTP